MTTRLACARCGRTLTDQAAICWPCTDGLRRDLQAVPALLDELDVTLARQGRTIQLTGGHGGSDPLPLDLAAADAGHALRNAVSTWARILLSDAPKVPPLAARDDPALWLANLAPTIRTLLWAADCAEDIARQVHLARTVVDLPPELSYIGRCICGQPVHAEAGASYARCRGCGEQLSVSEQRALQAGQLADRAFPAANVARILRHFGRDVPMTCVRDWRVGGQIAAVGVDRHGRPLYRLGDALRLSTPTDDVPEQTSPQVTPMAYHP